MHSREKLENLWGNPWLSCFAHYSTTGFKPCFSWLLSLFLTAACALLLQGKLPANENADKNSAYLILEAGETIKYSAPIKGRVSEISVKPQQLVSSSQKLFSLKDNRIVAKYELAKKEYLQELSLFTQASLGRLKRVDYARKAELERAFQKFRAAEILLSMHKITATKPGIVDEVQIVKDQLIRPNQASIIIKNIETLILKTLIFSGNIKQGDAIEVLIEIPLATENTTPKKYYIVEGKILSLTSNRGVVTSKKMHQQPMLFAEIEIENSRLLLKPGMKAYLAGTEMFLQIVESNPQSHEIVTLKPNNNISENLSAELTQPSLDDLKQMNKELENLFTEQGEIPSVLDLPFTDANQLIAQYPDLTSEMQSMLQELSPTYPELAEIANLSSTTIPNEFEQALASGEFDQLEFDLQAAQDYLNLSTEESEIFKTYENELKQTCYEEDINLDYVETLDQIDGVEAYKQHLLSLEHFKSKYGIKELQQLPPEKLATLKENVFKAIGTPALFDQDIHHAMSLDPTITEKITNKLKEQNQAACSHLESLVKGTLSNQQLKQGMVATLEQRNSIIQDKKRTNDQAKQDEGADNTTKSTAESPREARRRKQQEEAKAPNLSDAEQVEGEEAEQSQAKEFDYLKFYQKHEAKILPLSLLVVLGLSLSLAFIKYRKRFHISIFKKKLRIHDIEVGSDKTFTSINAAINSIHSIYAEKKKLKFDLVQIKVDAGEYFEQIDCEWNYKCLLKITGDPETPFKLIGKLGLPVIKIINAPGLMLESMEITGPASHAIELQSCTGSVVLNDLTITGFSQTGIYISKEIYEGEIKLSVEMVVMKQAAEQSRGLVINPRCYADFEASVEHVKFIGPMELGIEIISPVRDFKIQECVFAKMQYGLVVTSVLEPFNLLQIINNTFYKLDYGIVAERLDGLVVQSKQIHLFNNLFARIEHSEFTMIKEPNDQALALIFDSLYKFSEGNLSDGEPFFTRSAQRVLIFQNPRLDKYNVQFVSENSLDENYLVLNLNEKVRSHLLSFRGSRHFPGGVPPRGHLDQLYDLTLEAGYKSDKAKTSGSPKRKL